MRIFKVLALSALVACIQFESVTGSATNAANNEFAEFIPQAEDLRQYIAPDHGAGFVTGRFASTPLYGEMSHRTRLGVVRILTVTLTTDDSDINVWKGAFTLLVNFLNSHSTSFESVVIPNLDIPTDLDLSDFIYDLFDGGDYDVNIMGGRNSLEETDLRVRRGSSPDDQSEILMESAKNGHQLICRFRSPAKVQSRLDLELSMAISRMTVYDLLTTREQNDIMKSIIYEYSDLIRPAPKPSKEALADFKPQAEFLLQYMAPDHSAGVVTGRFASTPVYSESSPPSRLGVASILEISWTGRVGDIDEWKGAFTLLANFLNSHSTSFESVVIPDLDIPRGLNLSQFVYDLFDGGDYDVTFMGGYNRIESTDFRVSSVPAPDKKREILEESAGRNGHQLICLFRTLASYHSRANRDLSIAIARMTGYDYLTKRYGGVLEPFNDQIRTITYDFSDLTSPAVHLASPRSAPVNGALRHHAPPPSP